MFVKKTTLLSAAVLLTLAACGDSTRDVPAVPVTTSSGIAVDGYLDTANVLCVGSNVTVKTNNKGVFTFSPACTSAMTVTGGTNVDTGFAFKGTIKGPANSAVLSPLTTLLVAMTPAETAILLTNLGLPAGTDLTKIDPVLPANFPVLKVTLAIQQIAQQFANTFATLQGSTDVAGTYAKVAAAIAAQLLTPGSVLFDANGVVNATVLGNIATKAAASSALTIDATKLAAIATQIGVQAQQFSTAASAGAVADLAKALQNPAAKPIDTTASTKYLAVTADTLRFEDQFVTLAQFAAGVTVNNLDTIGIPFTAVDSPAVDTVSSVFMELAEEGGKGRKLQVMIDKVAFKLSSAGVLTVEPATGAQVYVFGHTTNGTDINLTLKDLTFNPLTVGANNMLKLDFDSIMDKAVASANDTTNTTTEKFTNITGTFATKIVVSNLNLRHADGSAFTTVSGAISGTTTAPAISGAGIVGKLTLTVTK
jgi:hypothetical protein